MSYTREAILEMLDKSDLAVEKAILCVFRNQTEDEKASHSTKHHNGRGFNGRDARYGTYLAQWLIRGNRLNGKHLDSGRKMARRYVGQLVGAANGDQSR